MSDVQNAGGVAAAITAGLGFWKGAMMLNNYISAQIEKAMVPVREELTATRKELLQVRAETQDATEKLARVLQSAVRIQSAISAGRIQDCESEVQGIIRIVGGQA